MPEYYPHLRFEKKIQPDGKCWRWTGAMNPEGYGHFTIGSRRDGTRQKKAAHVFSYQFYNGPVLPGQVVYRVCETHGCVNPDHLRAGPRSDMVQRAIKNGRWNQGNGIHFPQNQCGEKNPNSKLTDETRAIIRREKGITKAIVLSRRYNVSEGTIYHTWNSKTESSTEKISI